MKHAQDQSKTFKPCTFLAAVLAFLFLEATASAKVLQILHTNDLHSALFTGGAPAAYQPATPYRSAIPAETEYGGWPQIKATMDRLTEEAAAQGIETVIFDAGDFYEGSVYSFADQGNSALEAYQAFHFNATALGNHDWLSGAVAMDTMFGLHPFPFPVLAANFKVHPSLRALDRTIDPFFRFKLKDGTNLAVLGLTTTEAFYKWCTDIDSRKKDARFAPVNSTARKYLDDLNKDNDFVFALTHLGTKADKSLAKNTKGLDLIIGGHSHQLYLEPKYQIDRSGYNVPIVQAGANGKYLGRILLEYKVDGSTGKKLTGSKPVIQKYEVIPVIHNQPGDKKMQDLVNVAKQKLYERYKYYGNNFLDEKIGTSKVRLVAGDHGPSAFSKFVSESMLTQLEGIQVAFDFGAFHGGTDQAAGDITRRNLMDMYPRRFELDRDMGTDIWTAYVPGWAFKLALELGAEYGLYLATGGLSYEVISVEKVKDFKEKAEDGSVTITKKKYTQYFATDIKVNGQPIRPFQKYYTALPEAFVRGAFTITPLASIFLRKHRNTKKPMWTAMFDHLKNNVPNQEIVPLTPQNTWGIVSPAQIREGGTWAEVPYHLEEANFSDFMKNLFSMNDTDKSNGEASIPPTFKQAIEDACKEEGIPDSECPIDGSDIDPTVKRN